MRGHRQPQIISGSNIYSYTIPTRPVRGLLPEPESKGNKIKIPCGLRGYGITIRYNIMWICGLVLFCILTQNVRTPVTITLAYSCSSLIRNKTPVDVTVKIENCSFNSAIVGFNYQPCSVSDDRSRAISCME